MDLTQELYIPIPCATGLPKILLKEAKIFLSYPIFWDMKSSQEQREIIDSIVTW